MPKRGRKLGLGRHRNIPSDLTSSLEDLFAQDHVTRVILGRTKGGSHRFPRGFLKYQTPTESGIKVNGYSSKGVTEIFVSVDPPDSRQSVIDYIAQKYVR